MYSWILEKMPNKSSAAAMAPLTARALLIGLAIAALPQAATAQSITIFNAQGAGTGFQQGTVAYSLNDAGDSTGGVLDSGSVGHGFQRNANGKITVFDAPGAGTGIRQGTAGKDINASGEIAGYMIDSGGVIHGFFRAVTKKATVTTFDIAGAGSGINQGTSASAIDDDGDIAGTFIDPGSVSHGFVRANKKGRITTFDIKRAGTGFGQGTVANDISAGGGIVGQTIDSGTVSHGFVRNNDKKGTATVFDVKGAGTSSGQGTIANSINSAGEIVGQYIDAIGTHHAFLRDQSGTITKFDAPGAGT